MMQRFTTLVNVSSIASLNFTDNLVLHRSILQVMGFMDFIVPSNSSIDTGLNLLKDEHCDH